MKKISQINPYLQNKEQARISNARSSRTSCGVEGIVYKAESVSNYKLDSTRSDAVLVRMKKRLTFQQI